MRYHLAQIKLSIDICLSPSLFISGVWFIDL